MSLEVDDRGPRVENSGESDVVIKRPMLSYSREFLLSFSSLDICKKLPSGFDESILREFEEALLSTSDRPRTPGSLPLQGYRTNEYGSSPPTPGDFGNYSRGTYGRWDSRSSGRSDQDSDSQSDRDSESGRRYGHQLRRSWQAPEHDGLLGSGSFPRPSGSAAGVSASKVRTDEQYQLNKSREPYHPPRPYKAVPYSRRDKDSYNDETFGSSECDNEDRVEEERRRRASFELMRKEQKKVLQEKQTLNLEKRNVTGASGYELFVHSKEEKKFPAKSNDFEVSAATSTLSDNLEESPFALHSPVSRPLVPPGFNNNTQDKSSGLKSLILPSSSEVSRSVREKSLMGDVEANSIQNGRDNHLERRPSQDVNVFDVKHAEITYQTALPSKLEKAKIHKSLDVPYKKFNLEQQFSPVSSHIDSYGNLKDPEIAELNAEVFDDKVVDDSSGSYSTSILEKIFGSTLSVRDACSSPTEHGDSKPDDEQSYSSAQSSKFAQWFLKEEDNAAENIASARPNESSAMPIDLLSLIVTGDKADTTSESVCINRKEEAVPTILTCEDLEQSILSEYDTKTPNMEPLVNSWNDNGSSTDQHVDNHASVKLLSILHRSAENNTSVRSGGDVNLTVPVPVPREHGMTEVKDHKVEDDNGQSSPDLGKPLTLETLFGTAFMKELHSVGAPISAQKGPVGSAEADHNGLPYRFQDIENSSSVTDGIQRSGPDNSDNRKQKNMRKPENWFGFSDPQIETISSRRRSETVSKHSGLEGVVDLQLPEVDRITSVAETQNHQQRSIFATTGNLANILSLSSNPPPTLITNKLPAFSAGVNEEGFTTSSDFRHGSYEKMSSQILHHNHPHQQSSPLFGPQVNKVWPPYHHLESSHLTGLNSQEKFSGPDPIFNQNNPPLDYQFPPNMIRHPFHHLNPGFDASPQHLMLSQMQIPSNHHPIMLAGGPIKEMDHTQRPPFGPHMPNLGGHPVPGSAHDIVSGGNTPEAFQNLIEMQLRANSNQIHPFAHVRGSGGHGVDMSLHFR